MAIVKFSPSRSIFGLRSDMDRVLDNFLREWDLPESFTESYPTMDIEETDSEFIVTAEVPGMKKEDIKITFENNYLNVSGEKKAKKDHKSDNFHQVERRYGKFSRSVGIPSGVMLDKISAEYEQGILHIHIPKAEEAKPRQIEIKVK
ncbi:MAG: Hsp20/alpha crystallin family protein [Calditrichae bacterium]|nr:Hsp20/alpha crystallin family protein [Calditrichota bacterium]MCB9058954.1 Hsp20/alpha crystallin family protein [Calditrichia bacterium]